MSLVTQLSSLATAVASDIKTLFARVGDPASLTTTNKANLVAAVNEVRTTATSAAANVTPATTTTAGVVRLATLTEMATGVDPSAVATVAGVRQERAALKTEILGGVGTMADTLQELYDLAQAAEETAAINNLVTVVNGKADASAVYTKTEIGNPETDLVAVYTAAKA